MTKGTCPVCNGTKQRPCPDNLRDYGKRYGWYGYNAENDTVQCNNCGAQYMMGTPTGEVRLRPDGTPCAHEYTGREAGRCRTIYTCKHCNETYEIDSSD